MNRLFVIFVLLLSMAAFAAEQPKPVPEQPKPLPEQFAGWQKSADKVSTDPAVADPTNAALLKEYGFTDFEQATYTRPGRQMTVKAARFNDATGAYGAFTFYKAPEMLNEKFGDQGATLNERVLFYRGNILVQATLDKITAMSAAELRELGQLVPLPPGSARNLPILPQYLPKQSYVRNSAKYVVGPVGYATLNAPLAADLVDFGRGAEVVIGNYTTGQGTATAELISYPTPAIAGDRLRAVEALNNQAIYAKRTGPMLVLVTGQIAPAEAKALLASVNYEADVTWNERTPSARDNVANFLVNIIILIGIIFAMALVAGLAFGGVRLAVKRAFPGKVFDRPEDIDIIQLKIGK